MDGDERPGKPPSRVRQRSGVERRNGGDDAAAPVTTGASAGTNGPSNDFLRGWVVIAAVAVVVTVVNALTVQVDAPQVARWKPWVWEATSAVSILVAAGIAWWTARRAPPDDSVLADGWRSIGLFAATHLIGLLVFSIVHVAGFVVLRQAAYAAVGAGPYEFDGLAERFVYELRKDTLSYSAFVATFWLARRLRQVRTTTIRPVSFDIRDGARIIRAPLDDILAVTAAGNYVEFVLADGRRPLMRATLAAVEVELERFGFVRVHRSWLVNAARATGLRPEGSGDWTVELGAIEAPVSRRFPEALARLKG